MAKLMYSAIASMDGYVEDSSGAFSWSAPDDEVLAYINELERPVGTYLYGRRMYETMAYWETGGTGEADTEPEHAFAQMWRTADKIVYSKTITVPTTARTRVEPGFDPAEVARLKQSSPRDLSVGGADLAGQALAAGLVDECQIFLFPITVGGGKPAFPLGVRLPLELIDHRRFAGGTVLLHYAVRPTTEAAR